MVSQSDRNKIYGVLSELFRFPQHLPDVNLLSEAESILKVSQGVSVELSLSGLQEHYTELFINRRGGVPAPPYGSVYLDVDAALYGESTSMVEGYYAAAGVRLQDAIEPPDFLPTELEFMYYLIAEEEAAPCKEQGLWRERQKEFFIHAMQGWIPLWCERVRRGSLEDSIYRRGAEVLDLLMKREADLLV